MVTQIEYWLNHLVTGVGMPSDSHVAQECAVEDLVEQAMLLRRRCRRRWSCGELWAGQGSRRVGRGLFLFVHGVNAGRELPFLRITDSARLETFVVQWIFARNSSW